MALTSAKRTVKSRLFGMSAPDLSDARPPANGDYASYVEHLMRWTELEQSRQRSRDVGAALHVNSQWKSPEAAPTAGAADSDRMQRIKQKVAAARSVKTQQPMETIADGLFGGILDASKQGAKAKGKGNQSAIAKAAPLIFGVLVALMVFDVISLSWIPVLIIGWVVFNVMLAKAKITTNKK